MQSLKKIHAWAQMQVSLYINSLNVEYEFYHNNLFIQTKINKQTKQKCCKYS